MRHFQPRLWVFSAIGTALLVMAGCGGGGGGSGASTGGGPIDPPASGPSMTGTAKFSVNVDTGKVTVTPLNGGAASRAIFTGTAARFDSSNLLNDTGELTRRKLAVSLKNNTAEPIGVAGSGFKVMFGEFTPGISTDLRSKTTVSTLAGNGGSGSADGPALGATFSSPHSVLAAYNGDVYMSGYNQSVRLLRNGMVSTITSTSTGPLITMLWNSNGNQEHIYATALNTHKIVRITVATGAVTVLAGTGSVGGDDGPGSTARFNLPYGMIDLGTGGANPDLLVSEGTTGKLRLLQHNGTEYIVSTLPWTNDAPRGMTSLGNGMFAVSLAFQRKIAICDVSGQKLLLGTGSNGSANGNGSTMQFYEPIGVFAPTLLVHGGRTLYVTESSGIVRQITLRENGNPLLSADWTSATIAGVDMAFAFQDGRGDVAKFLGPVSMAMDQSGNILVADSGNQRIRKVTPESGSFPIIVTGGSNSGVDKVRLANATDFVPTDAGPTPYIHESMTIPVNEQVQLTPWSLIIPEGVKTFEFIVTIEAETTSSAPPDAVSNPGPDPAPGSSRAVVRTLAGATSPGYSNGSVSTATFSAPTAFDYDAQGVLYVADASNHAVRRITPSGDVTTVAGIPGNSGSADGTGTEASFGNISGIAVNEDGNVVYVTDSSNHTIRRIELFREGASQPYNWKVSTIAGVAGSVGYANGNGLAARFNLPWGIDITNGGELVVSESTGKRIRRLQPIGSDLSHASQWLVTLVAGSTIVTPPPLSVDGPGLGARFGELKGIAVARSGELYVADWGNSSIRRVSTGGNVTTFAGGVRGYGDSDTGSSAKFDRPADVAVDGAGYVYVADSASRTVRRVSPAGAVRTVAGSVEEGTADGFGSTASFRMLNAIEVTNAGDVILGDSTRIRIIERLISSGVTQ